VYAQVRELVAQETAGAFTVAEGAQLPPIGVLRVLVKLALGPHENPPKQKPEAGNVKLAQDVAQPKPLYTLTLPPKLHTWPVAPGQLHVHWAVAALRPV